MDIWCSCRHCVHIWTKLHCIPFMERFVTIACKQIPTTFPHRMTFCCRLRPLIYGRTLLVARRRRSVSRPQSRRLTKCLNLSGRLDWSWLWLVPYPDIFQIILSWVFPGRFASESTQSKSGDAPEFIHYPLPIFAALPRLPWWTLIHTGPDWFVMVCWEPAAT